MTLQGADVGDTTTIIETAIAATEQVEDAQANVDDRQSLEEIVGDKGYHSNQTLIDLDAGGMVTGIPVGWRATANLGARESPVSIGQADAARAADRPILFRTGRTRPQWDAIGPIRSPSLHQWLAVGRLLTLGTQYADNDHRNRPKDNITNDFPHDTNLLKHLQYLPKRPVPLYAGVAGWRTVLLRRLSHA